MVNLRSSGKKGKDRLGRIKKGKGLRTNKGYLYPNQKERESHITKKKKKRASFNL